MIKTKSTELQQLAQDWAEAELKGEVSYLDQLLTPDFVGIGPRGFVLNKVQWLDRYRSGSFKYDSLAWQDIQAWVYGDSAVVVGIQNQEATYEGQPSNGKFRGSQFFVKQNGTWRLAAMQLSGPLMEVPR